VCAEVPPFEVVSSGGGLSETARVLEVVLSPDRFVVLLSRYFKKTLDKRVETCIELGNLLCAPRTGKQADT